MISLKKYFFAVFLFSLFGSKAQFSGYTFCDWDKITFKPDYIPTNEDTAIVFVSVRDYYPGKEEFMGYEMDSECALRYFSIYFHNKSWICVPRQNLEAAFTGTDKSNDVVLYGEGMGKDFPSDVDRATRLARVYNVTTLMFDWPTYRPNLTGGKNYKKARVQSTRVSNALCDVFSQLEEIKSEIKSDSSNLTLFLHSLGNRLLKEAVTNGFIKTKTKLFDDIVLNAPCVKMRGHRKWLEKLNVQDKIYLTRNNKDRTLLLAKLAGFTEQLGRGAGMIKAKNAIYLNFSPVLEREHNYFLMTNVLARHPDLKSIYSDIFHGKNIDFSNEKKFINQRNGQIITLKGPERVTQEGDISIGIGN